MLRTRFNLRFALFALALVAVTSYVLARRRQFNRTLDLVTDAGGDLYYRWDKPALEKRDYKTITKNGRTVTRSLNSPGYTPMMPFTDPTGRTKFVIAYMRPFIHVQRTAKARFTDKLLLWTGHAESQINVIRLPISNVSPEIVEVLHSLPNVTNIVASQPDTTCNPMKRIVELRHSFPGVKIQPQYEEFKTWVPLAAANSEQAR